MIMIVVSNSRKLHISVSGCVGSRLNVSRVMRQFKYSFLVQILSRLCNADFPLLQ